MNLVTSARAAAALAAAVACSTVISAQTPAQAWTVAPQAAAPAAPMGRTLRPSLDASSVAQGFSVVLVLGDLQSGTTPDNVPPAAKKALADMKDFLPYKSYRLLDAEWILGSSNAETRLRGLDDQEYALNMGASLARDNAKELFVTFQLRDAGAAWMASSNGDALEKQTADLLMNRARLEGMLETLRQKNTENYPDVAKARSELAAVEKQLTDIEAQGGAARGSSNGVSRGVGQGVGRGVHAGFAGSAPRANNAIISTSFSMDPGETVVVGTSRLRGGDKALIALLTAVPRGKTTGKD